MNSDDRSSKPNPNIDTLLHGETLFQKGKHEAACNLFHQIVEADASNARAHNNLGVVYYNLGQIENHKSY
jgi:Flp pilus assembly protein TadD